MKILISHASDSPLYEQIKEQIKDAILKEELKEGDALPSIRAFANDLKVSVLTIRRVYEELEQEGFVTSQVGIGTFVSTSNLDLLRDSKRRLVEQKMLDMIQTAKSLNISKDSQFKVGKSHLSGGWENLCFRKSHTSPLDSPSG